VYLAPKLIGAARAWSTSGRWPRWRAVPLEFTGVERVGPDLRVLARIPGRDRF
jgi:diaminohydroxyphosphoribosylaminopyrimidine deaminase/5-amino-6-(5-phosphoribosylamino)uracil reductase